MPSADALSAKADQAQRLYSESRLELRAAGRHRRRAKKLTERYERLRRELAAMGVQLILDTDHHPSQGETSGNNNTTS